MDKDLPGDLAGITGCIKSQRGYAYFNSSNILFISLGEKNTGGYGIKVVSVEDIEGVTKVILEETSPKKGDMMTQVLTYPYALIKIQGSITDTFNIVNQKGEKLEPVVFSAKT